MSQQLPQLSTRLPLLALLLCYVLLSSFTTITYVNLQQAAAHGDTVLIRTPQQAFYLHRKDFLLASVEGAGGFASRTVQALNFPAMTTEMLVSAVMRSWPDSWRPAQFGNQPQDLFVWRGLCFPVYCLPFWWFVGLGLDALLQHRTLHGSVLLLGTLLAAFFLLLTIVMAFTIDNRHHDDTLFILSGFTIWTLLFSTFPLTWIRRRRAHQPTALPSSTEPSPSTDGSPSVAPSPSDHP